MFELIVEFHGSKNVILDGQLVRSLALIIKWVRVVIMIANPAERVNGALEGSVMGDSQTAFVALGEVK